MMKKREKHGMCAIAMALLGVCQPLFLGAVEIHKINTAICVDGELSERVWQTAKWEDGFRRFRNETGRGPVKNRTAFAILADAHNLYFGIRCFDSDVAAVRSRPDDLIWQSDDIEIFLSPSGTPFDYYHFAVSPNSKVAFAEYASEGGDINPDPYAPDWEHKIGYEKDCWTAEVRIPLSAFYMTRNSGWKTKWLMNVCRTFAKPFDHSTFAPLVANFCEPKNFFVLDGFPVRSAGDDLAIQAVTAEIDAVKDGKLSGCVKLDVFAELPGDYRFRTSVSADETTVALRRGRNRVILPCVYDANGRHKTHLSMRRLPDGLEAARDYPVLVDFQPIRVKLTTPQYRNNFYPGQDASKIAGRVSVANGEKAHLKIEGPGFPVRTAEPNADGSFSFDTTGFAAGDAWLTVSAGKEVKKIRIRNLPPSGHRMAWIENGNLVVDGRPTLRRNIYADNWMHGKCFTERYAADLKNFWKTSECETYYCIGPSKVIPGLSRKEAIFDVAPCAEYLARLDVLVDEYMKTDFIAYYIYDEPECSGISPIYLKHVYDHVAERDPYHPIFSATRGGKTYIECVDWAETHPYLDCRVPDENGVRTYGTAPNEVGRFLDAFEAWDRPDKCIGFLPTCFSYRWTSSMNDYPTFDEYVLHTWAAMMRGGKTLWPYAGHDLGDRPALYEGTKYIFSSFAALEQIVLFGKRSSFTRSSEEEGVLYELPDERMFVIVNFTARPRAVVLPKGCGTFREFRGKRTYEAGETVELAPLETIVGCSKDHDGELPSRDDVRSLALRQEAERKGRDNQLRGRYDDLVVDSNMTPNHGGGFYKLIDGTRDFLARFSSCKTNSYIEVACPKSKARFSIARVWGHNVGSLEVDVRKRGEWRTLTPKSVKRERWMTELDFGEPVETVKVRFRFPMPPGRNEIEVYELELPWCKARSLDSQAAREAAAGEDVDVKWKLTGSEAVCTNAWDSILWFGKKAEAVRPTNGGGFAVSDHVQKYVPMAPEHRWLVMDVAKIRDRQGASYRAWFTMLKSCGLLSKLVTHPQAGIYTFRLPDIDGPVSEPLRMDVYGLSVEFNSIACMAKPANWVAQSYKDGVIRVRVQLASAAEEVAGEFLVAFSSGDMNPFPVNGSHTFELKPLDDSGCRWGADISVLQCGKADAREVFVKVSALDSALTRPLFGNFAEKFEPL